MSEAVQELLSRLDPKTRQRVTQASEIIVERQLTPSLGLNSALKGGIGYGRQTLVWGNKSSGKSSMCLQMVANAQKDGKICAWIDAERSYDKEWADRMGVNSDDLIISPVSTIDDMASVGSHLMEAGADVVVVDSISSLLSSAYFEKDSDELKSLDKTKQIGSEARDLANAVKMLNYANKNTALVLISQIRNKITTYGASHQPTGGHAVMFFSSTSIKLWSSAREADQINGNVYSGDKIFAQPVGRPVTWTVEYNKIGPPNQTGKYDFYYDGEHVGVDSVGEILDVGEKYGLIVKAGKWYKFNGESFNGRQNAVEFLRENPDIAAELSSGINGGGNE